MDETARLKALRHYHVLDTEPEQAFDDLTADRPGAQPIPIKDALQKLEQLSGSAFDPSLVEQFCRTMREQPPQQ